MIARFTSKLRKYGKGAMVTIPSWYVKANKLKVGDKIHYEIFKIK